MTPQEALDVMTTTRHMTSEEITDAWRLIKETLGDSGREPFAWWLVGGTEIFLASEFTPDTEHRDEWCPLYR